MFSFGKSKAVNLRNWLDSMIQGTSWIAGAAVVAMMMLVTIDVLSTKVLNEPIQGTLEITEELMAVLVILGLAITQVEREHLRASFLLSRFSQRWRDRLDYFGYYLFGFIIVSVFSWRSVVLIQTYIAKGSVKQGYVPILLWPTAVVLSIGFFIFCFLLLYLLINKRHLIKGER